MTVIIVVLVMLVAIAAILWWALDIDVSEVVIGAAAPTHESAITTRKITPAMAVPMPMPRSGTARPVASRAWIERTTMNVAIAITASGKYVMMFATMLPLKSSRTVPKPARPDNLDQKIQMIVRISAAAAQHASVCLRTAT